MIAYFRRDVHPDDEPVLVVEAENLEERHTLSRFLSHRFECAYQLRLLDYRSDGLSFKSMTVDWAAIPACPKPVGFWRRIWNFICPTSFKTATAGSRA